MATFAEEALIFRTDEQGHVRWDNHFATIGTGSSIAEAFLCQRSYDDSMPLVECLYRVLEAKCAAEKNPYVGKQTVIGIAVDGVDYPFSLTDRCHHVIWEEVSERLAGDARPEDFNKRLKGIFSPNARILESRKPSSRKHHGGKQKANKASESSA